MVRKEAGKLKVGEKIKMPEGVLVVSKIELSSIGKHGVVKCRIEALSESKELKVLIRPSNYPVEVL
ncbi:hypothetical protein J4403_03275 [Candidatus Woesearchaeota archaeon]|nr:hypothetical protein [Candidatus Woesearchaeota archaeon]